SLSPEDDDDADELVRVCEERERRDRDLAVDSVPAGGPEPLVVRAALVERDPPRQILLRQGLSLAGPGREARPQIVDRHVAHLGERAAEDSFRGLVVEDDLAALVGD